ncbi:MAG: D-Ala-D-Ala carboxypeptidase family metallohydrolase [Desulfobaccales bacterium]
MGDLSANLDSSEITCHCGCGLKSLHPDTVAAFQQLRDLVGSAIQVNCGCRCPAHNTDVGGEPHSFHLPENDCRAMDIVIPGKSVKEMYALAEQIPAFQKGGIGRYYQSGFIHVDTRNYQARWTG